MRRCVIFSFVVIILLDNGVALEKASRQKRCIVIQKQSGGNADSGEGSDDEEYDFKKPEPKDPRPDRLLNEYTNFMNKKNDVEDISPESLKYKKIPNRTKNRRFRIKNRFLRNNFD